MSPAAPGSLPPSGDPVVVRRARIARGVRLAKRAGYLALGASIIAFAVAAATGFPTAAVAVSVVGLVAACVVLPVPIVLGYGIRAATREDAPTRQASARDDAAPRQASARDDPATRQASARDDAAAREEPGPEA